MFSLGFGEIVIICLILIVVVGPERLPSVMKSVGKTMRTVRQASRDLRETVGLDELMRDDYMRPLPPPPRPAPPATVSRAADAAPDPANPANGTPQSPATGGASGSGSDAAASPAPSEPAAGERKS